MRDLTRDDIRRIVWCPLCGASAGTPCNHRTKGGSKKMRDGVNHRERASAAQSIAISAKEPPDAE